VYVQELEKLISELAIAQDNLKDMATSGNQNARFEEKKVELLEHASALLDQTKSIMVILTKQMGTKAGGGSATSVSTKKK